LDNKFTYRNKTKQCHMRADREKNIQTDIITILHTLSEKLLTEKSTNSHFNFVLSGLARLNWVLRQKDRSVGCPRQHGVIHQSTAAAADCRQQSIYHRGQSCCSQSRRTSPSLRHASLAYAPPTKFLQGFLMDAWNEVLLVATFILLQFTSADGF